MWRRTRILQDLDQKIREHIEMATRDNIDSGMSAEEARHRITCNDRRSCRYLYRQSCFSGTNIDEFRDFPWHLLATIHPTPAGSHHMARGSPWRLGSHEMLRSMSMYQPSVTVSCGSEFDPSSGTCFLVVMTCLAE
jgi:hypothetical protein